MTQQSYYWGHTQRNGIFTMEYIQWNITQP